MSSEKKENNHLQIDEKSNQTKTTSPNQSTKMTTTTSAATATNEMSINCNLYTEYTDADEKLFARADLTEHQLKLKDQDPAAFWKSVNENVRSNLQDALVDNEEAHNLKNLMKIENKELLKECARMEKLAKEAQEIVNQYKQMI